MWGLSHPLW